MRLLHVRIPVCCLLLAACAASPPRSRLASALAALVDSPALAGGRVGVLVVDSATGTVLAEHEADRGFAPASNNKLLSSAVALTTLGPDRRLATEVSVRGEVLDGVLQGDLVLRGGGDPTFLSGDAKERLDALVGRLHELGIRRVHGRVVGDGSWLGSETLGLGWQWDYLDEDYAAPFGGLCAAENVVTVRVRPSSRGPEVVTEPFGVLLPTVRVEVGAAGTKTDLRGHRRLGSSDIEVTGTIAADAKEQVLQITVADPAAFAAMVVTAGLRAGGIEIDEREVPAAAATSTAVMTFQSPPIAEIVSRLLTHSNNLYAEVMARASARIATGVADTTTMAEHAAQVLRSLGVDVQGLVMADGSGLSRRDLVHPRQLVQVLLAMRRSPLWRAFEAGLPLAGVTGTLHSRFADGPAKARVRAKTGYISRVVCLSGYVPRPGSEDAAPWVFSVMLNDFTGEDALAKAAVDGFVQQLAAIAGW